MNLDELLKEDDISQIQQKKIKISNKISSNKLIDNDFGENGNGLESDVYNYSTDQSNAERIALNKNNNNFKNQVNFIDHLELEKRLLDL